jgi:hypothetical protein
VERGGDLRLGGKGDFRLSAFACGDDLLRRAFSIHRSDRQRRAQTEHRAMLSFELGLSRTAGAHQTRLHCGHADTVFQHLSPQPIKKTNEGEFAAAIRQEMRHADATADRAHIYNPAVVPPAHLWQQLLMKGKSFCSTHKCGSWVLRLETTTELFCPFEKHSAVLKSALRLKPHARATLAKKAKKRLAKESEAFERFQLDSSHS